MTKASKLYFLTAYVEYLYRSGIRQEEAYLGDASRFLRFLLGRAGPAEVEAFIRQCGRSPRYQARVRRRTERFLRFCRDELGLSRRRGAGGI